MDGRQDRTGRHEGVIKLMKEGWEEIKEERQREKRNEGRKSWNGNG